MPVINNDLFNRFTAQIMHMLDESHPVPRDIMIGHLTRDLPDFRRDPNIVKRRELWPREAQVAIGTIEWLAEQGYIRYDEKFPFGLRNARLDDRAYSILHGSPVPGKSKTWSEWLARHGSSLAAGAVDKMIGALIARLAKDFLG